MHVIDLASHPGRRSYRALATTVAVTALASVMACHHAADDDVPPPVASAATKVLPSAVPVDQLAPGELIEGPDTALGLPLPRGSILELKTQDAVIAYLDAPGPAIDAFVKARAVGARATTTEGVLALSSIPSPADKTRLIEIKVRRVPRERASRIEVRDVTPAPKKNLPNDEARFREVGLDMHGHLIDPLNQQ